jgi:hypothetical protein
MSARVIPFPQAHAPAAAASAKGDRAGFERLAVARGLSLEPHPIPGLYLDAATQAAWQRHRGVMAAAGDTPLIDALQAFGTVVDRLIAAGWTKAELVTAAAVLTGIVDGLDDAVLAERAARGLAGRPTSSG